MALIHRQEFASQNAEGLEAPQAVLDAEHGVQQRVILQPLDPRPQVEPGPLADDRGVLGQPAIVVPHEPGRERGQVSEQREQDDAGGAARAFPVLSQAQSRESRPYSDGLLAFVSGQFPSDTPHAADYVLLASCEGEP